jgi:uncharacterized protein with HEPN domain
LPFRSPKDHLKDILQAVDLIEQFVEGLDFAAFQKNPMAKAAVEREFSILSEAAYRLGDDAETMSPGPDWTGLRGMGNILRHAYHRTNDAVIWTAIEDDLPILKASVTKALATQLE